MRDIMRCYTTEVTVCNPSFALIFKLNFWEFLIHEFPWFCKIFRKVTKLILHNVQMNNLHIYNRIISSMFLINFFLKIVLHNRWIYMRKHPLKSKMTHFHHLYINLILKDSNFVTDINRKLKLLIYNLHALINFFNKWKKQIIRCSNTL